MLLKKNLKILKRHPKPINRKWTDNTMAKEEKDKQ